MCTRVLRNTDKYGPVLVGRTMDWPMSTQARLAVFPRGRRRHGGKAGEDTVIEDKDRPHQWTSDYGSIVACSYGIGSVDGINERGLAAHLLYLKATDTGPRTGKPGIHIGLWAQYVLDKAATVEQALTLLDEVDIVKIDIKVPGEDGEEHEIAGTLHLALEDAQGDSAIIEYVEGKRTDYHHRDYTVMTNDPPYNEQLKLLEEMKEELENENGEIVPSRDMPLPGNVAPIHRFQRATYFHLLLPKTPEQYSSEKEQYRKAVAGMLAIARNVSVPPGAPYNDEFPIYDTEYRTLSDLTNMRYFFELGVSPNLIWTGIDETTFQTSDPDGPVKTLNPYTLELDACGDVTELFTPQKVGF
ncbi:linear amide C-N hydrolase [Streptomyces hirsutus]|uniref:linear amide C-N hydrolase n=1 Tax=Streptomyces hirsutus TaxID=35620 RepID=UPI0006E2E444|nr:linear amide C-N hydrolase [Streptomyces hirsutus]